MEILFDIGHMVIALIRSRRKADTKRGENPILGKHVLVELRQVNHFLMIFVLKSYIFQVNSIANRNYSS